MSFCLRPNVCKKCGKPLTIFEGWTCLECERTDQELCDDAISREAVLKKIDYEVEHYCKYLEEVDDKRNAQTHVALVSDNIREEVEQLPPITQKSTECEDAISRQVAIDTIESWLSCDDYSETERHIMRAMQSVLYDLPPVTPQQKYWKWIKTGGLYKNVYSCSECSRKVVLQNISKYKFCPNCGACMKDRRILDEFIEDSKTERR